MEKHQFSSHYLSSAAIIKTLNTEMRAFRQSAKCKDCEVFVVFMKPLWCTLRHRSRCWDVLISLHFTVWSVIRKSVGEGLHLYAADGNLPTRGFDRGSLKKPGSCLDDCAMVCGNPRPLSLNWFVSRPIGIIRWCVCVCVFTISVASSIHFSRPVR